MSWFWGKKGTADAWNITYILLGYVGATVLFPIYRRIIITAVLVIVIAIIKEIGDSISARTLISEHWFWDRRGGDYNDVLRAAFGVGIYFFIYWIFLLLKII